MIYLMVIPIKIFTFATIITFTYIITSVTYYYYDTTITGDFTNINVTALPFSIAYT